MSEITYISEELVMEGNLDSAGSSVVVAGRFKGELRAKDVLLEANSIFDGDLIADKVTLGGLVKGEVAANTLNSNTTKIGNNTHWRQSALESTCWIQWGNAISTSTRRRL